MFLHIADGRIVQAEWTATLLEGLRIGGQHGPRGQDSQKRLKQLDQLLYAEFLERFNG